MCHGFDGAGVQGSVEAELADLAAELERVLLLYNTAATTASLTSFHGEPAVSWDGAPADATTELVTVVAFAGNPVNAPILSKAAWNYFLIMNDSSKGVHNPSFAHEVLFQTTQRLRAITAANQ